MVYKRYVKRNGKLVGPYYYKTVKCKDGKTKTIYLGRSLPEEDKKSPVKEGRVKNAFYAKNISQLKNNIRLCNAKKEALKANLKKLFQSYQNKELSYSKYELLKNSYLKGKTPEYWYDYYDNHQKQLYTQIKKYVFASSCLSYIQTVSDVGKELEQEKTIPQAFQKKISQLQNNALVCEQRKVQIRKRLQEYKQKYDNNLISYSQYELLKNSYLKGKTPEYWFSYYNNQKLMLDKQVNKYELSSACEEYAAEVFEAKPSLKDKVLTDIVDEKLELEEPKLFETHKSLTQIVSVLILLILLIPSFLFIAPMLSDSFLKEQPIDLTNLEFSVVKEVSVVKGVIDKTVVSNTPKKQEREQQELKKSYEKEVIKEKLKKKGLEEKHEQEPSFISKIVEPVARFLGAPSPTGFAITGEENITPAEGFAILPEENVTLPSDNITLPEENVTIPENVTLPEESIILPEENVTLPEDLVGMLANIEDKLNAKAYRTNLKLKNLSKEQNKFSLEAESDTGKERLVIRGLDDVSDVEDLQITALSDKKISKGRITTQVASANVSALENATITLAKEGGVNAIVKCEDWSFTDSACERWVETGIPFTDDEENITFTVIEFSGYAGAEINIINVQSYPMVGGNWTVMFNTTGEADLTIKPVYGTTWDYENENAQLKFLELRCEDEVLDYEWVNESLHIANYSCDEISYETSKVLTAGKHSLEFDFGGQKAYAYNSAGQWWDVQHGDLAANTNANPTVTLDRPVNWSRAFVSYEVYATSSADDPDDGGTYVSLDSTSSFSFHREVGTSGLSIVWYVIEGSDLFVQYGTSSTVGATPLVFDNEILPVNESQAVVFINRFPYNTDSATNGWYQSWFRGNVTNSTNVQVDRLVGEASENVTVSWFAVEFPPEVYVQQGEWSSTADTATVDLANAVNRSKSFIYITKTSQYTNMDDSRFDVSFVDDDTIHWGRGSAGTGTTNLKWAVVELPEGSWVQEERHLRTSGTDYDIVIDPPLTNLSRSFACTFHNNTGGTGSAFGRSMYASNITSITSATIEIDYDASTQTHSLTTYIVELPAPTVIVENNPPSWSAIDDWSINEDAYETPFTIDLSSNISDAEDSDADLQISWVESDTSAVKVDSINNVTNEIVVSTIANQSGTNTITLTLVDTGGLTAEESFTITVTAANDPPWWDSIDNDTGATNIVQDSGLQPVGINASQYWWDVEDGQALGTGDGNLTISTNETNINCALGENLGSTGNWSVFCNPTGGFLGDFIITLNGSDSNSPPGYELTSFEGFVVSGNAAPNDPTLTLNFTYDETNYTNESMWCEIFVDDPDVETDMSVDMIIINTTTGNINDAVEQYSLTNAFTGLTEPTYVQWQLNQYNFTKNDYVWCQARVNDQVLTSNWVNSSSLKVENYPIKISDPLGNWSVNEDFTQFTLDWTTNYTDSDDAEGKEAYTNWTYEMNDTNILTISIDNDTDVVTITPIENAFGSVEINWTVLDDDNATYNETVVWTVNSVNDAPVVENITFVGSPSVTLSEGIPTQVIISFLAMDFDGAGNFDNSTSYLNVSKDGSGMHQNVSAVPYNCYPETVGSNATAQNYTCTMQMDYWDLSGDWTCAAEIKDGSVYAGLEVPNCFTVGTTTAINISATALDWSQLFIGDIDKLMSTSELNITNTGNVNLTNITLQGINLVGESTNTVWIPAANFTATWGQRSCNIGNWLINDTNVQLPGSMLDYGPGNLITTNNATHICLEEVGQDTTPQAYSTTGDIEDWTITGVV